MSKRPMFPLQSRGYPGIPSEIPWAIVANYGESAMRNHDQTLERLAERGGLSPCELIAVLEQRQWRKMTPDEVRSTLLPILSAHNSLAIDRDAWKDRAEKSESELVKWQTLAGSGHSELFDVMADRENLRAACKRALHAMGNCGMQDTDNYPEYQFICEAIAASEAKEAR